MAKDDPSKRCLKCQMAACTARSSLSKVECLVSVGESFLLKKARGCLAPWRTCSRTAPMAMSLASVESTRGRPGIRNLRYAAEEKACFVALASVESTRGRPGIRNLRYAAEEKAYFAVSKAAAWAGPQVSILGLPVRAV